MNESPEGNFSHKPLQPVKRVNTKEWNEQAKPFNKKIVDSNYYDLLKILVYGLIGGIIILGYMAYDGKLKSEINIPDCSCPEVTIPPCPSMPNISNNCQPTLNCGQVLIPANLTVTLSNSS